MTKITIQSYTQYMNQNLIPLTKGLNFTGFVLIGAALLGLFLININNYLFFHVLAELFSIIVAFSVFILAWKSKRFIDNGYLLFVGVAFLFVGSIDLIHTLAFKGMGVFPQFDTNLPTQLWIAARYLQAGSMLAALFFLQRRINPDLLVFGFVLVVSLLMLSIFVWGIFPDSYIEGEGLTPFKKISEYIIASMFAVAAFLLHRNRKLFESTVLRWLLLSLFVSTLTELAFTEYVNVYGFANMSGHLLKILAFYFIFKAIVETGLERPYDILFHQLKQREEDLSKSESRLRRLVDSNVIGVIFTDSSGNINDANEAFINMLGYSREEQKAGKLYWSELTPPEYLLIDERAIVEANTSQNGACTPYEKEFIRKDGDRVPVLVGFACLEGSQTEYVCFVLDLTERKKAQQSLLRIEWMLTKNVRPNIASHEIRSVSVVEQDTHASSDSRLLLNTLGKQVLNEVVSDFLDLLDTSAAVYEKNGEFALWTFSSGWCSYLSEASRRLCGSINDEQAQKSGKWHCYESCWNLAARKAMLENDAADVECLGGLNIYSVPIEASGQVVGTLSVGYGDPPKDLAILQDLANRFGVPIDELLHRANSYETRPPFMIEVAKNRLHVSARLLGSIVERKQAESAIQIYAKELERTNKELKDFAFIASHDLQEPLRKIQAFGEKLSKHYSANISPEAVGYLDRMNSSAKRLQLMIQDLLAYSRITTQAKPFEQVDLSELATEVISDLEVAIDRVGGRIYLEKLPMIEGDALQMRQLLQNLISNALKFHKEAEPPVVKIAGEVQTVMENTLHPVMQLTVSDNGIGFDEQYLDRIFQPFQRLVGRSEFEGSGIGLAICRKIVDRHSGEITATSVKGQGTTFKIILPLFQPKQIDQMKI